MTVPPSAMLEFPAMLHGRIRTILRAVGVQGKAWAREYLERGTLTPPRRMLQVPPDALLEMRSGLLFDDIPHWRVGLLSEIFVHLMEGVPQEKYPGLEEAFEALCLNTPWGAVYYTVTPLPPPPRSAERMAHRFAALLRFWDVLQVPRYAYRPYREFTLEELMEDIYRRTLEAWCPQGPAPVREHMALAVERMAHATREECTQAVLRLMPVLVASDREFKHRERLGDPGFLREQLSSLPAKDFDDISSGEPYSVTLQLADWDRALGR